jgi:hypothetical protein
MQAYVSKEFGKDIIYLNPMFITERPIVGYDIPDHSDNLVKLNEEERKQYQIDAEIEYKYRASMYMLRAMKIKGNGCIIAAHQFG